MAFRITPTKPSYFIMGFSLLLVYCLITHCLKFLNASQNRALRNDVIGNTTRVSYRATSPDPHRSVATIPSKRDKPGFGPIAEAGPDQVVFVGARHVKTLELSADETHILRSAINDSGDVVWAAHDGNDDEIFLFDGVTGKVRQLTYNDFDDVNPDINCQGDVVWHGYLEHTTKIFLYEKATDKTFQLAGNEGLSHNPHIACSGDVVWTESKGVESNLVLFQRETATTIRLSQTGMILNTCMSMNGDVAWKESPLNRDSPFSNLFLYDRLTQSIRQLTNNGNIKGDLHINCNGDLVWDETDGLSQIFVYDKGKDSVSQLTEDNNGNHSARISCEGDIVWLGRGSGGNECGGVFFYNGKSGQTTRLVCQGLDPSINTKGDVVWSSALSEGEKTFRYDKETGIITQLNDQTRQREPKINSKGDVVWHGYDGEKEKIILALIDD
jgi:hypothetical protein